MVPNAGYPSVPSCSQGRTCGAMRPRQAPTNTSANSTPGIAHDPGPSPAAYPLLGAGSGDARPLTAQVTAGTQPPCQGRGPAACRVCWCISPRCPAAAAGMVVVSGHPLQGGARALAPEPAGSWSEGLLFHHRVLTLHYLNHVFCPCSLGGSCEGRFALRSKPYPMGPHPFCAQRSKAGAY